jgi:histidyl-tRNA synthetase
MANKQFQNVRGTYDVLPGDQPKHHLVLDTFRRLTSQAGYGRIDTPLIEDTTLFVRGVGVGTDIVDKEMYVFDDRSGNSLCLRPEGTAGVVRAFIQHGMNSLPKPVKLAYSGPMFRYERPQAGRYRQHTQVGAEALGEASPSIDAQVIVLMNRFYKTLGLTNVALKLNSIGDENCRPKYKKVLIEYLKAHQSELDEDCRARLETNPLRVLDCKEAKCQAVIADAPQTLNYLCGPCHEHMAGVIEYLDDLGIAYDLEPKLVRGLDYYTRTVFEFYGEREGSQSAIGGGGRYDLLVEQLGGQPTPAVGFAIGIERVIIELEAQGVMIPEPLRPDVFVASLGEPARLTAFRLIEELLDGGVAAVGSIDKDGIGAQLGKANKLEVPYAAIIGQKEVFDKTVILRDMTSGAQETLSMEKVVNELQKRFHVGRVSR